MWFVVGIYILEDEPDYEEILEECFSFHQARSKGLEYAPWFGDDWIIKIRHESALTGRECSVAIDP